MQQVAHSWDNTFNGQLVPVAGQAGLVVTFSADGTELDDLSTSQPLLGQYRGMTLTLTNRGRATFKDHASGGKLVEAGLRQALTSQFALNGVAEQTFTADSLPITSAYVCGAGTLTMSGAPDPRDTATFTRS